MSFSPISQNHRRAGAGSHLWNLCGSAHNPKKDLLMQVAQSHILLSFQYLKIERLCNLFEQLMLLLAFFHSPHQIQLQVCFGFSNHTHTSSLHSLSILLLGSSLFLLLACSHLLLSLLGDACSPSQVSCHICLSFCFSRWSNLKFGGAVWKSTNSAALLLFTTVFYGIIPSRALQSPKSAFLNTRTMVLIFGNFFFFFYQFPPLQVLS